METENKMEEQITLKESEEKQIDEELQKKCVIYKDPDEPYDPLMVKVSLTLYEVRPFDVAEGTVQVVFEMALAYQTKLFNDVFGSTRDALPWILPNALELDATLYSIQYMYGLDLDSLNIFATRQKFDKDANLTLFTVELYTIRATLKLITFPSEDPFQSIFLVFKLAFVSTPGAEVTIFKAAES